MATVTIARMGPKLARRSIFASALLLIACGGGTGGASTSAPPDGERNAATAPAPPIGSASAVPAGDWTRFDFDAQRSGVGPPATGITAGNVRRLRRRTVHIDGVADSSAVELHTVSAGGRTRDVVVVTTTYGKTIAIDPGTGAKVWEYRPPDLGSYEGSSQITTASPVVDPDRSHVYVSSPDGRIRKLAVANGGEVRSGHWPVSITFDPTREKIAGALNISRNSVVAVTGGYYGDAPSYQGHVVLIDRASGRITHVFNTLCSSRHYLIDPPRSCPASDSAIWARAGAIIEPSSRRILVATGNGPFNGVTNWGNSVLELSANAGALLHNWTPPNGRELSASDTDVGSSGPALVPKTRGYRLVVQGAKDGKLHLLNLNRLNGTRGGASPRTGGEASETDAPGGGAVLTAPAVWTRRGRTYVFVADDSGTAAYIVHAAPHPHLSVAWQHSSAGTSPVLAGGLLYVYDEQGGRLNAYRPAGGQQIASLRASGGHWSSPIIVGGRIVLPTGGSTADDAGSSSIYIYHLLGR